MKVKFYFLLLAVLGARILLAQSPSVTSIIPVSGPIGTLVKITGSNLLAPTQFQIGGVDVLVISNDGNNLVGMVMPGAVSGSITIATGGGNINAGSFTVVAAHLPTQQIGQKIVPSNMLAAAEVGWSTSISADGNTVAVGGHGDNNGAGAIWIYTRSGNGWAEQGKIPNPGMGLDFFGESIDISADGNTIIVGAMEDSNHIGAAYVYVKSGLKWIQETKLVGSGYVISNQGLVQQGKSVAISADGSIAMVGAVSDGLLEEGAIWFFKRTKSGWVQDGNKVTVPNGHFLGDAVALSADGLTALSADSMRAFFFVYQNGQWVLQWNYGSTLYSSEVALSANGDVAAVTSNSSALIFSRSGMTWTGPIVLQTSAGQNQWSGGSVDLSADGNTVIIGDAHTANDAMLLYVKQGQHWLLQASLHGTLALGKANQIRGRISADGQALVVGGPADNNQTGAFWMYGANTMLAATLAVHSTRTSDVVLPITVKNFSNIISVQLEVDWDPAVATFVDVEGMGITSMNQGSFGVSQVNGGKLTLSWFDPMLTPQTLSDGSVLFNIRFKLTGSYNSSTAVTLKNAEMSTPGTPAAVQVNVTTQDGSVSIDPSLAANGEVTYVNNNNAVQNVVIDVTGSETQNTATDATGKYSFTLTPATLSENYTFTPSKVADANDIKDNIDVTDVTIIHQHILQTQLMTDANQLLAADVDQNGIISTIDLVYIQSLILGKATAYPGNALWLFTPASHAAPLAELEANTSEDFAAVMLGDVTFSWGTTGGRVAYSPAVAFDIRQEMVVDDAQGLIEIPVRAKDFSDVSGYQFTVNWDASKLEYKGVVNKGLTSSFGEQQAAAGKLAVLWYDAQGRWQSLGDKRELFVLQFVSRGGGYKDVTITNDIAYGKVVDKRMAGHDVTAMWSELDKEDYSKATSVYPNPFSNSTTIEFYSDQVSTIVIPIMDELGREVRRLSVETKKGMNRVVWDGRDGNQVQLGSGVYVVEVLVNKYKVVKY